MNALPPLPTDWDAQQSLRLRRFRLASLTYAVCVPLMLIAHQLGLVGFAAVAGTTALIVSLNLVLFALFRLGINRRFADPSLTRVQMFIAILVLMAFAYAMDRERSLALILCPFVLMFGGFRFKTQDFLSTAVLVLVAYGAVIGALMLTKPQSVDLNVELFRWLVLACLMPCFGIIAGKVSELRMQLRRSNDDLSSALGTIQELATRDTLTGLPNRALFNESLQRAVSRAERSARPIALFFLDLDRFKIINDTLGHQVGDQVLNEAARRLGSCVREGDMAARLGGDEFVVLVEEYEDTAMLAEIAKRILAAMVRPMLAGGHEVHVSASIGVCTYPADARDAQTLVSNADIAMYRAKDQGRNMVRFYSPRIDVHSVEQLNLESGLRRALDRNELRIHFQPKIRIATGGVSGVEALLRWDHPELGLLVPDRFIGIAEESGLIVPIGLWALRTSCRTARAWQDLGMTLPIAVNLSARQFHRGQLDSEVALILEETGLEPKLLEIEITESMVMQNPERSVAMMHALRRMGVRLTLDDFGIGHSSLAHVKRFPIDNLKLDHSFVRDLPDDINDVAIARAVIAMSHTLRIQVIAEGVERREQLEFLRAEGCDEYQGFHCQPALPEEALLRFMRQRGALPAESAAQPPAQSPVTPGRKVAIRVGST